MEKKILAVDDDPQILEMLNVLLRQNGYEVKTLSQAEKVFSQINSFRPDLILLDVMLSGLDGTMICSALKTFPDTQHIPVIYLTGNYTVASSVYNQNHGTADDFVLKPFNIQSLINKIEHQLAA